MADTIHANMTGSDLHEPKGVSTAANNTIAQASGGAVSWSDDITVSKLLLSSTVWEDMRVSLDRRLGGGTNDPDFIKFLDNGSGSAGVYAYAFDAASEEELFFELQLSHKYKAGTDLKPHIHWSPATTNTGSVVWGLEYSIVSVNGTFGNTSLITVADAGDGTAKKHQVAAFTAIDGTGITESAVLVGRVYRKAADASDTFTGDAFGLYLDFHYEAEKIGSDDEYPA